MSSKSKKTRRANKGSFRPGPDARRHVFTTAERSRGGQVAWERMMDERPWLLAWLQRKIDRTAKPETIAAYRVRRRFGTRST